jgi:hypothetical protein
MRMYTHEVAVVEHETERTVKTIKVESERRAEQVERGLNINLDHRFYYTEVRDCAART